jgi:DNA helicase-2/ATP-dependent DNA helicase PcrA
MTFEDKYRQILTNANQQDAILLSGNVVVQAGPGSGKTRLATVKAALALLNDKVVACISYSRVAARKMRAEFLSYGIPEENIVFATVHSFCLNHIVYKYLHLYKHELPEPWNKLPDNWVIPTDKKREASGISKKSAMYRVEMIELGYLDFEMIGELAFILVKNYTGIRESISYHFDTIIIDEYQDLSDIFHKLISFLASQTKIVLFVVGDSNQAIYQENGEKNLNDLVFTTQFHQISTQVTYRFGQNIAYKSASILKTTSPYKSDPSTYQNGDITIIKLIRDREGDKLQTPQLYAEYVVRLLNDILQQGQYDVLNDIAVLYSQRKREKYRPGNWEWRVPDLIVEALHRHDLIQFVDERAIDLPNTPLVEWIQDCASWCFSNGIDSDHTIQELANYYENLYWKIGLDLSDDESRTCKLRLRNTLVSLRHSENLTCGNWVMEFDKHLQVTSLIRAEGDRSGELAEFRVLSTSTQSAVTLATSYQPNKVVFTTIHSSKGRQFKYVIVVGIQAGLVPWLNNTQKENHFRKLTYVACTRASRQTYIVTSPDLAAGQSDIISHLPSKIVYI